MIILFPDGKAEWEAIYKARTKFVGHEVPKVPLCGYLNSIVKQKYDE